MFKIEGKELNGSSNNISHGFFGRTGGVSQGLYESLNCALKSSDDLGAVMENREQVAMALSAGKENLVTLSQVHGAKCVIIDKPFGTDESVPNADALVTDRVGVAIGVLTADCAPILFAGEKANGQPVIGAAHAGWGGALKGVGEATIEQMITLGAQANTIRAVIGPCIAYKSYEVSTGFEKAFLERDPEDEHFFREAHKQGHLMFDLAGYVAKRLAGAGVQQIAITGNDTFADEAQFFSYRRATHAGNPDYGRQISAISILF